MPDAIHQELGFDASQALQTLAQLDAAMAGIKSRFSSTAKAMGTFNAKASKTSGLLNKLKTSASGAATQMNRLNKVAPAQPSSAAAIQKTAADLDKVATAAKKAGDSAATAGKKGKDAANKWTVSWETMVRVVATQAIVRVLNTIRQSLKAAIGDAVKFQRAVAEIGTIGGKLGGLENIASTVTRISDAFNVKLDDTTEAAYQTISNQIAQTSGEMESFLGSAARFSKVTKTDMATSVNLLSGTLNAFGKTVEDTEDVAAKFFKTIELGRTRAEELAHGYGTVAPIADKLGISMEELNASVATLTINGIKTDKAFTQIRGTMQAFLKPTTEMKEALKELGFASGEQLLQANNLQEALKLVSTETDGSASAIARLFPRIRGLTGVLTALSDERGHFTTTIREQEDALQDAYNTAYELVIETDAEKITKDLNKLKNFFTVEFGQAVLEASIKLSDMVGGAEGLIKIFKAIAPVLPQVAFGLFSIGSALLIVKANALLATGALKGAIPIMSAFAVAALAGQAIGNFAASEISERWDDEFQAAKKSLDAQVAARKRKVSADLALEKRSVSQLTKLLASGLAESQKEYFKVTDAAKESNKQIIADVKSTTTQMISERQKLVNALESQVSSMGKNILDSEKSVASLRDDLDDKLFNRKLARDSERIQVDKLVRRSSDLARDATSKLSRATTTDERNTAQEEFQRAKAFAEQALSIADGTDERRLEQKALGNLKSLTEDLIDAEKRYQSNIAASAKALVARTAKETKRVEAMKKKQEELLKALSLTDEEGQLLPEADREAQLVKAQKKLREFIDLSGEPLDVAQMLNYTGVAAQLNQELHLIKIEQLRVSEAALKGLSQQVKDAISGRVVDSKEFGLAQSLSGVEITGAASQTEAINKLEAEYKNLLVTQSEYSNQVDVIATAQTKLRDALDTSTKKASSFSTAVGGISAIMESWEQGIKPRADVGRYFDAVAKSQRSVKLASEGSIPSLQQIDALITETKTAAEEMPGRYRVAFGALTTGAANSLNSLKELVLEQQKLRDISADSGIGGADIAGRLAQFKSALDFLKGPEESAKAMEVSVTNTRSQTEGALQAALNLNTQWNGIGANAERAAAAAIKLQNAQIQTTSGTGFAHGGQVGYFANGGHGTDTIAAMLSKGETVTNARSSRRFFSQLQAINAGQQPVYRSQGGDTFNTNVGDINVQGAGKQPTLVAREVMKAIRREERRGSGR